MASCDKNRRLTSFPGLKFLTLCQPVSTTHHFSILNFLDKPNRNENLKKAFHTYIGHLSWSISLQCTPAIITLIGFAVSGGFLDFGGRRGDNFQPTGVGPLCELQPKDGADKADESPTFDAYFSTLTSAHLHNFFIIRVFVSERESNEFLEED